MHLNCFGEGFKCSCEIFSSKLTTFFSLSLKLDLAVGILLLVYIYFLRIWLAHIVDVPHRGDTGFCWLRKVKGIQDGRCETENALLMLKHMMSI